MTNEERPDREHTPKLVYDILMSDNYEKRKECAKAVRKTDKFFNAILNSFDKK